MCLPVGHGYTPMQVRRDYLNPTDVEHAAPKDKAGRSGGIVVVELVVGAVAGSRDARFSGGETRAMNAGDKEVYEGKESRTKSSAANPRSEPPGVEVD